MAALCPLKNEQTSPQRSSHLASKKRQHYEEGKANWLQIQHIGKQWRINNKLRWETTAAVHVADQCPVKDQPSPWLCLCCPSDIRKVYLCHQSHVPFLHWSECVLFPNFFFCVDSDSPGGASMCRSKQHTGVQ